MKTSRAFRALGGFAIAAPLLLCLTEVALSSDTPSPPKTQGFSLKTPPKIAMIYYDRKSDGGWIAAFETARLQLEKELGVEIAYEQNVTESSAHAIAASERFISEGYNIIIGTGSYYSDTFQTLATRNPDIAFLNAAGTSNGPNLQSFYGRTFDSHYLCGMVAGAMSKHHKIGYVAAREIPVVNWGVNGFILGVRQSDPDGTVMARYNNDWANPRQEAFNANTLIDLGADVIGQHVNTPTPQLVAQARGALGTGHHSDMSKTAPKATVCSSVWRWGRYLLPELKEIMAGNWKPDPEGDLPSFRDGPTDIVLNMTLVPEDLARRVMKERQALFDGKDVFVGALDQNGMPLPIAGPTPSRAELWAMDWHVEGFTTP
ncbi:MAG: BMP family ABC transporter substrate-binding protein [Parvibaculum sp.]|nr:BMP family ABC transporter substrate-binding protein [Parvibaculum sp.]